MQIIVTDERLMLEVYRATATAAGFDLRAMIDDGTVLCLQPGEAALVPTGLRVWIKDPKLVGLIFPRSGTGHKKGLVLGNGTGVIDSDYQGPLMVSLCNRTQSPVTIEAGERIAQLVLVSVTIPDIQWVSNFDSESERGEKGFGSSGTS